MSDEFNTDLRDFLNIEVTASSASVNKEADRQSALMLVQVLGQYYDKKIQMLTVTMNPGVPPEMKNALMQIDKASDLAIERLLRTFDNVRDPKQFIPQTQISEQPSAPPQGNAQEQPGSEASTNEIPELPVGREQNPTGSGDPDIDNTVPTSGVLGDTSAIG